MKCPMCGGRLKETETFCNLCGTPLGAKENAFTVMKENPVTKPLTFWKAAGLLILLALPGVNLLAGIVILCRRGGNLNVRRVTAASLCLQLLLYLVLFLLFYYHMPETLWADWGGLLLWR